MAEKKDTKENQESEATTEHHTREEMRVIRTLNGLVEKKLPFILLVQYDGAVGFFEDGINPSNLGAFIAVISQIKENLLKSLKEQMEQLKALLE